MKKVLVVLLSLCMVLGCFSFAFAIDYSDVAADNKYAKAIDSLSELGVLEGYGNGTFGPNDKFTRAQAAVVLVKLLGQGAYAEEQTTTKFSDVPASHWASGWVAYAANLGLVEGYGDGKFGPDDNLTYNQWLTMVMRAEGYKDQYLPGDWPTNFVVKASSIGLVDSTLVGNKEMTRAEMAQVAYNSIDDRSVSYNLNITGDAQETFNNSKTFLEKMGYVSNTAAYATNPVPFGVADKLLADHVGETGTFYYVEKSSPANTAWNVGTDEAVAFFPTSTALTGVYTAASGTTPASFKAEDGTVYGFTANFVPGTTAPNMVVKNGANVAAAASELKAVPQTLNVALASGKIDAVKSIVYWEATQTVWPNANAVKALATALGKTSGYTAAVQLGTTKKFAATTDGALDTSKVIVEGAVSSLADIKAKDVITVYDDGTNVTKLVVSRDTVHGVVTKIAGTKYTINGAQYQMDAGAVASLTADTDANGTPDALEVTNTTAGTYYLTKDSKLFAYAADQADDPTNYAVVLEAPKPAVAGGVYGASSPAKIYLMTTDGTKKVYDINKDCTFTTYGAITTLAAETAPGSGVSAATNCQIDDIVKVAFNDAGEVVALTPVADADVDFANATLTATGVLDGGLFTDNAFIVLGKGNTAANHKVVKVSDLKVGVLANALKVVVSSKTAVLSVATADAAQTTQTIVALFNGSPATVANANGVQVQEVSVCVNGVTNTYLTNAAGLVPATSYQHLYVVKFTNGVLTYIDQVVAGAGALAFDDTTPPFTPAAPQHETYKAVGTANTYVVVPTDGVQGNLVNYGTATAPAYKNVAGATVYVAKYDANGAHTGWTIGTLADVVEGAAVCLYQTSALKSGVDADVIFVNPADAVQARAAAVAADPTSTAYVVANVF